MAITRQDIELAKYILDQNIYRQTPLDLRDAMTLRAFLSALEEHQDRPTENVKSHEWRAMVYRKLLDDPAALQQFTMEAMKRFTPDQIAMMLHPEVRQAVIDQNQGYSTHEDVEEALSNMNTDEIYSYLDQTNHLTDIIDWFIENDPDYVREALGINDEIEALQDRAREAYDEGYEEGFRNGQEQAL